MEQENNTQQINTAPMLLNRRQRRYMLRERGLMKEISKLPFLGETRSAIRNENMSNGIKLHNMHLDAIEKLQAETLEAKLISMKETWSNVGYNEAEQSLLEEAWALSVASDKSSYREDKKRAIQLIKEANTSRAGRN